MPLTPRQRGACTVAPVLEMRSLPTLPVAHLASWAAGETTVDSVGRILVPKHLRDSLGMQPGTTVDVTAFGAGLQVLPAGRTARIVQIDRKTVAESDTPVTDDIVFGLIDTLRR
jgi:AbrB family looped-hinge helix DNA binding protein